MDSHSETKRERPLSHLFRIKPFFKALLISISIVFAVLVVTGGAIADSMLRHSAAAPRPRWEGFLASVSIIFHFPSLLIATPFQLFIFAPLIQIALMTGLFIHILRIRKNKRSLPLSIQR